MKLPLLPRMPGLVIAIVLVILGFATYSAIHILGLDDLFLGPSSFSPLDPNQPSNLRQDSLGNPSGTATTSRWQDASFDDLPILLQDWIKRALTESGTPTESVTIVLQVPGRFRSSDSGGWRIDLSSLGLWLLPPLPGEHLLPLNGCEFDLSGNAIRYPPPGYRHRRTFDSIAPDWQAKQTPRAYEQPEPVRRWLAKVSDGKSRDEDMRMHGGRITGLRVRCSDTPFSIHPLGRLSGLRVLELDGCPLPLSAQWTIGWLRLDTLRLSNPKSGGFLLLAGGSPRKLLEVDGGSITRLFRTSYGEITPLILEDGVRKPEALADSVRLLHLPLCDPAVLAAIAAPGTVVLEPRCGDYPLAASALRDQLQRSSDQSVLRFAPLAKKGKGAETAIAPGPMQPEPGFLDDRSWQALQPRLPLDSGLRIALEIIDPEEPWSSDPTWWTHEVHERRLGGWWSRDWDGNTFLFSSFPDQAGIRPGLTRDEVRSLLGIERLRSASWLVWHHRGTGHAISRLWLRFDDAGGLDAVRIQPDPAVPQ